MSKHKFTVAERLEIKRRSNELFHKWWTNQAYRIHVEATVKEISQKLALGMQPKVRLTKSKAKHFMKLMRYKQCSTTGGLKHIRLEKFKNENT